MALFQECSMALFLQMKVFISRNSFPFHLCILLQHLLLFFSSNLTYTKVVISFAYLPHLPFLQQLSSLFFLLFCRTSLNLSSVCSYDFLSSCEICYIFFLFHSFPKNFANSFLSSSIVR